MDLTLIGLFAAIAIAIFLFEWGMLRSVYAPARQDSDRIKDRIKKLREGDSPKDTQQDSLVKDNYQEKNSSFYQKITQFPGVHLITLWIEQSGQSIKLNQFLWTMVGAGIVSLIMTVAFTQNVAYALPAGIIGFFLPVLNLLHKKKKRLNDFDEHLPEAMDIMTRALRAGHPFNTTLQLCAEELKGPIAEEMAITFAELNFGVSTQAALKDLIRRVPSKSLKSLVTAILLQRETGGNLAEILEKISHVIREGYKFQRKIKTLSAEGKMSSIVLASVPIVMGLGMFAIQPDVINELFVNPDGQDLLKLSGTLYLVGFIWIRLLIKIEV